MKRRCGGYGARRSSYVWPTLSILLVSLLAALGGAFYWDRLQQNDHSQDVHYVSETQEEIPLPPPEEPLPEDDPLNLSNTSSSLPEPEPEPEPEPLPVEVPLCDEVDTAYFSDAAFVGDSLTQGLQLYDILDTNVVANKGVNLQTVYQEDKIRVAEGYTSVLKELERIQPSKIYVLLGANDIGWRDEAAFRELYAQLVDSIQEQHPTAILYLQSMFPVTAAYSDTDNGITNDKLQTYNQEILSVAEEKGAYYLDVASVLRGEDGALPDEVSPDGMHLNAPYYQLWFDYLKTHVIQIPSEED